MSFLKNINCDRYKIEDIVYKTFTCDDCTAKKKEFSLCENGDCPKNLKNFGYISLQYLQNPIVYITTPVMTCLFGVDKNTWNMSLQFTGLKTDTEMKTFFRWIDPLHLSADHNVVDL